MLTCCTSCHPQQTVIQEVTATTRRRRAYHVTLDFIRTKKERRNASRVHRTLHQSSKDPEQVQTANVSCNISNNNNNNDNNNTTERSHERIRCESLSSIHPLFSGYSSEVIFRSQGTTLYPNTEFSRISLLTHNTLIDY